MEYADGGDLQVTFALFSIRSSIERIASLELDSKKNLSGKLPINFSKDLRFSTNTMSYTEISKARIFSFPMKLRS
jgi:hypothetical protein